jgi:hypothetical protein
VTTLYSCVSMGDAAANATQTLVRGSLLVESGNFLHETLLYNMKQLNIEICFHGTPTCARLTP